MDFPLYVNDIPDGIRTNVCLFVDEVKLKIFNKITMYFSERDCLVSGILPQVQYLKSYINKTLSDPRFVLLDNSLSTLKVSVLTRFESNSTDYITKVSTFQDPQNKNNFFIINAMDESCKINFDNFENEFKLRREINRSVTQRILLVCQQHKTVLTLIKKIKMM